MGTATFYKKTDQDPTGAYVYIRSLLEHICVDGSDPSHSALAVDGKIKRAYTSHDVQIIKYRTGQEPNINELDDETPVWNVGDYYYNPRTKKLGKAYLSEGTKTWAYGDPGDDRCFIDLSTGELLHFHNGDMFSESGSAKIRIVSSTAVSLASGYAEGDCYLDPTAGLLYYCWKNASGVLEWMNPQTPSKDKLYVVQQDNGLYYWDGAQLVSIASSTQSPIEPSPSTTSNVEPICVTTAIFSQNNCPVYGGASESFNSAYPPGEGKTFLYQPATASPYIVGCVYNQNTNKWEWDGSSNGTPIEINDGRLVGYSNMWLTTNPLAIWCFDVSHNSHLWKLVDLTEAVTGNGLKFGITTCIYGQGDVVDDTTNPPAEGLTYIQLNSTNGPSIVKATRSGSSWAWDTANAVLISSLYPTEVYDIYMTTNPAAWWVSNGSGSYRKLCDIGSETTTGTGVQGLSFATFGSGETYPDPNSWDATT